METLDQIIFYTLEKSIKTYRQFAQKQINQAKLDITIDQWLILKTIEQASDLSQHQIAERVFKDYASVTRMIELLVKKKYLARKFHATDRRRFELVLTKSGLKIVADCVPVIQTNRKQALKSLTRKETEQLKIYLNKIIANCTDSIS
ncbi:MAG: MarR family winged helix-turn-helix transcriptional regulator [Bacteroidia bacterium]